VVSWGWLIRLSVCLRLGLVPVLRVPLLSSCTSGVLKLLLLW
jgi:hypothetical protein